MVEDTSNSSNKPKVGDGICKSRGYETNLNFREKLNQSLYILGLLIMYNNG